MTMDAFLRMVVERGASDLHLKAGHRPMLRVDGALVAADEECQPDERVRALIAQIVTPEQLETFHRELELDPAYSLPGILSTMQASAREGMQTLNQSLRHLVKDQLVSFETALSHASNPQELAQLLGREGAMAAASS